MNDLISRQAAIDALNDELTITGKTNAIVVQDYIRKVNVRLNDLPSAEPERKTGKWIEDQKGGKVTSYKCSVCGRFVMDDTGYDVAEDYPFCHCGADMRGEQDD